MGLLEQLNDLETDIDFCTVTDSYMTIESEETSYTYALSRKSGGANINVANGTVVDDCLTHIYGELPENVNTYEILIATNFDYVTLDLPITEKYIDNAIKYGNNFISDISQIDEDDLTDCADTDDDGLWDFQEIKVFKGVTNSPENQIIKFENGELKLPTINEMTKEVYKDMYTEGEINSFRQTFASQYGYNVDSEFWKMEILPIYSNPQKKDTDGDKLNDNVDVAPFFQTEIPEFFKELITNHVVRYDQIVKVTDECYLCTKRIPDLAKSDFVRDYIFNENDISYSDWAVITSGLNEETNNYDCIAAVYVGSDVIFFAAPFDIASDELLSIAQQTADSHRKAIASQYLEDDISYNALRLYSERLQKQQKDKNEKFEDYISNMYNSHELYDLLGFYDDNGWRGDVLDFGSSAFDNFYKSAFRCVYYLGTGISNIRTALMVTNVKYIEYVTWYRHEYPNSSFDEEWEGFISYNADITAEYIVLDINDRLMNGTFESRGEICGEVLFAIFLDVSIAKVLKGISAGHTGQEFLDDLDDIKLRDIDIDGNNLDLKSRKAYNIGDDTFTITLRPENYDGFEQVIYKLERKSDFFSFLNKSGIDADDIIERIYADPAKRKLNLDSINKHFDDFIKYAGYNNSKFVNVFTAYPQYADDIIMIARNYGDNVFEAISKSAYAEDAISLISTYGDDGIAIFTHYGDDVIKAIGDSANTEAAIALVSKFGDDGAQIVLHYGDDVIEAISKSANKEAAVALVSEFGDDGAQIVLHYGDDVIEAISKIANKEAAVALVSEFGDDGVKVVMSCSDETVEYLAKKQSTSIQNIEIIKGSEGFDTELDDVDFVNKVIYEDKDGTGLYNEHNKNPNKEDTWAEWQILVKSRKRLNALIQPEYELHIKNEGRVSFLKKDISEIKTYVIRIEADTPQLRTVINKYVSELENEFSEYGIDIQVEYGYKK